MTDVAVVGSLHLDIMIDAPRLPGPDETLMGSSWHRKCGGKGGNQAVAAARMGARTAFGGAVGDDEFGRVLRANLGAAGVDAAGVLTDPSRGSGMSVAIVDGSGEYGAVVVSGANLGIPATGLAARWAFLAAARVLLLQNEVPEAVNLAAARASGGLVVLNAAPARPPDPGLLARVGVLVVNRVEARMLAGGDGEEAALALAAPGRAVVLTRGARGALVAPGDGEVHPIPAPEVRARSAHGAGDMFCGALAARLAAGEGLLPACGFAVRAAALFVSLGEDERARLTADRVG